MDTPTSIRRISLVGAGNVAGHLAAHLAAVGLRVVDIFVREQSERAAALAQSLGARLVVGDYSALSAQVDLLVLAVSDGAIAAVAGQIAVQAHLRGLLVAHTSGATPVSLLEAAGCERAALFYPLQSFTKGVAVDMRRVPFLVSAARAEDAAGLRDLAALLSDDVQTVSEQQRAHLHLAAVFVNNFSNHLCYWAEQICATQGLDWRILRPLLQNTVSKLDNLTPFDAQTGAARRGDENTLQRHRRLLEALPPQAAAIYELLTQSIQKTYGSEK